MEKPAPIIGDILAYLPVGWLLMSAGLPIGMGGRRRSRDDKGEYEPDGGDQARETSDDLLVSSSKTRARVDCHGPLPLRMPAPRAIDRLWYS